MAPWHLLAGSRGEKVVKLEDVARRARVSITTVSRVLNNTAPVKNSTRARILRAVKELRYHPNLYARTLAGGKNRTLGMIVSNLEDPFFLDIFRALQSDAHQHGNVGAGPGISDQSRVGHPRNHRRGSGFELAHTILNFPLKSPQTMKCICNTLRA